MNNLTAIYEAITPENLKNISIYDDSMKIFIELLEKYSNVSLAPENFFNHNMSANTEEELIKIYLYDYYSMIQKLLNNQHIISRFRKENEILRPELYTPANVEKILISDKPVFNFFEINGSVISENYSDPSFDDTIGREIDLNPIYRKVANLQNNLLNMSPENVYFNRMFKETKGFYSSMIYIYNIINKFLTPEDERLDLELLQTFKSLHLINESGLYINTFPPGEDEILKVGTEKLPEPFKFKIKGSIHKTVYKNTVQYLAHPLGFVYDYSQVKQLKLEDYFSLGFSYENSIVEVRCILGNIDKYDLPVKDVIKYNGALKIIFSDSSTLIQDNNQIKYYNANGILLKEYPPSNNCVIYYTYNITYTASLHDSINFKIKSTLDSDEYNFYDKLKHVIQYSPKLGLIIGLFKFNDYDKFNNDSNIYRFRIFDDYDIKSFGILSVNDIVKILEDSNYTIKQDLDIEHITFNEEIKEYKIELLNKDYITINEDKHLKVFFNTEQQYDAEVKEKIKIEIPILADDKEIILDSASVSANTGGMKENVHINDGFNELLKVNLGKDTVLIKDLEKASVIAKNTDSYDVYEKITEKSKKELNEKYDLSINEKQTTLININNKTDNIIIDDTFIISATQYFNDPMSLDDVINAKLTSRFLNYDAIGEYIIGDNNIINDSDNYKYYDNIDTV